MLQERVLCPLRGMRGSLGRQMAVRASERFFSEGGGMAATGALCANVAVGKAGALTLCKRAEGVRKTASCNQRAARTVGRPAERMPSRACL